MQRFIDAITELVFLEDVPHKSDIIFVPGSFSDIHVLLAAQLYHAGYAPYILPSGKYASDCAHFALKDYSSEWEWMKMILCTQGVPESSILCEDKARFTWDNARNSRIVTDALGMDVKKAIICVRPSHARRATLYYRCAYPDTQFYTCPASEPGYNRDDWHQTIEGRQRILGEVRRLGDQIIPQMEEYLVRQLANG